MASRSAKLGGFGGELRGVGEVLELASAAGAEVGAGRSGADSGVRCRFGIEAADVIQRFVLVGHVEEAEARECVGFEQAFLQELLLDLLDLHGLHLAAVGSEFAVGLGAEGVSSASGVAVRSAAKSFSSRTVRVRSSVFEVQRSRFAGQRGCQFVAASVREAGGGFGGGGGGGRGE